MHALNEGKSRILNIGSGNGYSVRQVLHAVESTTGRKLDIRIGPRRSGDPAVLVASNEKLTAELSWKPRRSSLQEIVESAWKWKRRNPNGYANLPQMAVSRP
jgi:UDP-glucose 4-epimerase